MTGLLQELVEGQADGSSLSEGVLMMLQSIVCTLSFRNRSFVGLLGQGPESGITPVRRLSSLHHSMHAGGEALAEKRLAGTRQRSSGTRVCETANT